MTTETMSPPETELDMAQPVTHDYSFTVANKGWYLAVFNVTYRIGSTIYDKESPHFGMGSSQEIPVPHDAREITVKADLFTFFGVRKTIFSLKFPEAVKKCYTVWNTVGDPKWAENPCGS